MFTNENDVSKRQCLQCMFPIYMEPLENKGSSAGNIQSRAEIMRSHFLKEISTQNKGSLGRKIDGP